ncbi:MAG: protein-glutamate O-methyltransferase CheR [Rhodospirillaceae bacterium]|nr:protein-glutamate O-methyltransferase CheR [Rhodospirillaceae bacterium]
MTPNDFEFLQSMLKQNSGLVLDQSKTYLVESRLQPIVREKGLPSLGALVDALRKGGKSSPLTQTVVEAMTTNETLFFRDMHPFEALRKNVLPDLLAKRSSQKKLRIWCAAASTGQEPYSIAMTLSDMAELAGWRIEILGTDISTDALDRAKKAAYSQFEVQRGLPIQLLVKNFKQEGDRWHLNDNIRNMVQYRPLNLLLPFSSLGTFDIVFCRNVLIYFDAADKRKILDNISNALANDGFMFLGGAETVLGITDSFQNIPNLRGIYRKSQQGKPQ